MIHAGEEALILPSPISSEMSAMRLSLWTGLLGTVVYNQNRQQTRVRIFESGLRFVPDTQAPLGIRQDVMLAGVICGNRYEEHWNLAKETVDFYDLKAIWSRSSTSPVSCPTSNSASKPIMRFIRASRRRFI